MVVVDEFSRFPQVELLTSTSAKAVVPKLDAVFSRQGVPDILKSDNGPPLMGMSSKTADCLGFKHRKIIPLWPKENGEAEHVVQTLEKNIRIAHIEGKNWKLCNNDLRQYRATPHSTTHVSPCEALNSTKLKTLLPETPTTRYEQQQSMF